ncbi:hypothetical protein [Clostridium sporogenes]|uniref:phosphorylase family protein n=1 Tax=Clostridium sporogenes TaxID=1509 RepID=UPI0006B2AA14|nr:hypothetical protein [Clostridium sporogenes]KOY65404.1 hypothetical protein AN649_13060 [Clostridium sporogenes]MDS1006667.1 hypothetical protein [Clostridium sporogenes]
MNLPSEKLLLTPNRYLELVKLDKLPKIQEPVILTFNEDVFYTLKQCVQDDKDAEIIGLYKKRTFFKFRKKGKDFRVFLTGDSAPAVAFSMEVCIARGAKYFIGIGFTASLSKEYLNIGEYFIPLSVIRNDGVSEKYIPREESVLGDTKVIDNIAKDKDIKIGLSCSIDTYFRHTTSDLISWRKMDVKTLDMESGAFYSVAQYYNIPAILINIISEEINESEWNVNYSTARSSLKQFYFNKLNILRNIVDNRLIFNDKVCLR